MDPVRKSINAIDNAFSDQTVMSAIDAVLAQAELGQADLTITDTSDITEYLSGDEYVLPAGLVLIKGAVDLGDKALRLSTGTVLRGFAEATVTSSVTGGVVRATNVGANVILREFSIIATGGPCLNLTGPIDYQLNVFFVGLFGVSAGTISGFDVQAFKDCFINAADGFTFDGTTNKLFISQCPFYGITGSAITLAATYVCTVADIVTSFFKFDAPGVGITAEAGYTVTDGIIQGSLVVGTATSLAGLSPGDVNWKMTDNLGVRDSLIAGKAAASTTTTITIATQNTFVQMEDTFVLSAISERFVLTGSELEYTGRYPALVDFVGTFTLDPAASTQVAVRATLNGVTVPESEIIIEQGVGAGASSRAGTVAALHRVVTGDLLGIALANQTDATDVDVWRATFTARG